LTPDGEQTLQFVFFADVDFRLRSKITLIKIPVNQNIAKQHTSSHWF